MTGTIVGLAGRTRTGTIRSRDGSRLTFSAASVLGDFDSLAVGHLVSFDLERAQPQHTAVRVFREPLGPHGTGKAPGAPPDLRYMGFQEAEGVRSYRFDAVAAGDRAQRLTIRVEMALLLKHHVGVQEAPVLCLRKLAADLRDIPDAACHELNEGDLAAYASSRALATERKRPRHPFGGRRGPPPPGPSGHIRR